MDQVRDDFGIGFGPELIALGEQFGANRFVVFDDAVVDDGNPLAGQVRMRIGFGHAAVRGPARMRNSKPPPARARLQLPFEFGDLADGAPHADGAIVPEHGEAGGIVAAILQAADAFDENFADVTLRDGADDSTHFFEYCREKTASIRPAARRPTSSCSDAASWDRTSARANARWSGHRPVRRA